MPTVLSVSAIFITRSLKKEALNNFTLMVLALLESYGYRVVRMVADNHRISRGNLIIFGGGSLKFRIPLPLGFNNDSDELQPFIMSFDPVHVIKNIRNQFLDRKMSDGEGGIDGVRYLSLLYRLQKSCTVRLVRCLTRKHVFPSNLEKKCSESNAYFFLMKI